MASDEQLMQRAADGDMDAFERLVERHQQDALNVAGRFLGGREQARDVVQEAFLKILDAAPRYRPTAKFRTYLFNVIYRLCVDLYRKGRPAPLAAAPPPADPDPGPAGAALADERAALVQQAVRDLPPRQRMALVLKHFEGMSYAEIARSLECTPSAVDGLLSRARGRLKEALRDLI